MTFEQFKELANKKFSNKYQYSLKNEFVNQWSVVIITCNAHGSYEQKASHHLHTKGCRLCQRQKRSTEDVITEFTKKHGNKYDYSKVNYTFATKKLTIVCQKHGEFNMTYQHHLSGQGCHKCAGRGKTREDVITEFIKKHGNKYDYSKSQYVNPYTKITIICPEHGEFQETWHTHMNGIVHCKQCYVNPLISETSQIIQKFELIHHNKFDYSKVEHTGLRKDVIIKCDKHGEFLQRPDNHLAGKNGCKQCSSVGTSNAEQSLLKYIQSLNFKTISNTRQVIAPQEIDIYIPEKSLAIEYNGLYWHSQVSSTYHMGKTQQCILHDIQLIHIFEDEWSDKQDIVKSRLSNILGITPKKIYARKCEIHQVASSQSMVFLHDNHLQGNAQSKIKFGLYYENELVALMTFSKLRAILGTPIKEGHYELLRFCNKINTTVIGGASKLLKHFIDVHRPVNIISYSDRRWSQGEMYKKLGFDFIHHTKPNYFYIIDNKRKHRSAFMKHKLVAKGYDVNLTEKQIMSSLNINRIYDCGASKWSLSCT